jgi:hypothetical protein
MTTKASALALAALAALAFATAASAAPSLSLSTAGQIAKRLAQKEIRGRHIVAFHVTKPHRVSSREIDFRYDDRSRSNIYCTARMVITLTNPSTGHVFGRVTTPRCRPIPTDALALEAVTARAVRATHARRGRVNAALASFRRSLAPCARLRVPRADRAAVRAIVNVAALEAIERPVGPQVAAFVQSLGTVTTGTPAFQAAIRAWSDYLAAFQSLPQVRNACGAIRTWARHGYARSASPVDFATLDGLNARTTADARAIARAARRLAADGVFPQDVVAFTPSGLLLQVKVKPLVSGIG